MEIICTKNHIRLDKIALFVYIVQCNEGALFIFRVYGAHNAAIFHIV